MRNKSKNHNKIPYQPEFDIEFKSSFISVSIGIVRCERDKCHLKSKLTTKLIPAPE